ncbi:MAG TPA: cytochrome P450 [Candidatus Binataceae bacterium]|jgi:cytochrome P450|nr:cytochrome P450 [Candidatus Binataceae bacterium]
MTLEEIDLTDADFFLNGDPHQAWTVMRAQDPVHWDEQRPGRGYWSLTRYDDARFVYLNADTFSNEHGQILTFGDEEWIGNRQMMLLLDPPHHTQMRLIISKRFTPRAVAPEEAHVREIAAKVIDAVAAKGECDFVTDVAARIPTAIICEMMGVPRADQDMMFELGSMAIGANDPEYQIEGDRQKTGEAAQQGMFHYFVNLVEQRRRDPGSDLVSALVHGEMAGRKLSDMEVLFNCFLLILGGQETTRNTLSGGMMALIENPAQWDRLDRADSALMRTTVEEFLRWTSPITHVMRTATRDAEIRGRKVKAGDKVVIWNASVNRDEQVFADPFKFDVGRWPNEHLAFGYGEHFCLGAQLARLELRIMIEEVTRRMRDMQLTAPVQRLRSNSHAGIKHMPVRFTPSPAQRGKDLGAAA